MWVCCALIGVGLFGLWDFFFGVGLLQFGGWFFFKVLVASGGCGRGCGFAWLRVEKNVNCLEFGLL